MPPPKAFAQTVQLTPPGPDLWALAYPEREVAFDWGFDLEMPYELLAVFARHIDSAAPITRLPVFGIAHVALTERSVAALADADRDRLPVFPSLPLGVIGTDHVGYGSFDLGPLRHVQIMQALRQALLDIGLLAKGKPHLTVRLDRILVMPFKDPKIAFDALTEGDRGANFLTLRMDLDAAMLVDRPAWPPMPAMQTPSILDWRLSPGSFSMSGALLVGEDGCETLLPANLATRLVRFQQLVRTPAAATAKLGIERLTPGFQGEMRLGFSVQYNTEWFPIGHSLGQIAYSLPLAPGEKIKIAIVDWSRRDVAKRTEQTEEKEDLQHAALRDRSLTESVDMVVRESQSGSSFMAGGALSAGAGIPIGPVSLGVGAAFGAGGGSSDSQGMRSVVGDTTQMISDAFHQASSAQRELNSTVVIQSDEAETAQARTRVVANYNHSHALTILYYEVLAHQRVLTRPVSVRPVLFLKHTTPGFDTDPGIGVNYEVVERYKQVINDHLLDTTLRPCLDVVTKRACMALNLEREKAKLAAQGDPLEDTVLGDITLRVRSGTVAANANVSVNVVTTAGGQKITCNMADVTLTAFAPGTAFQGQPPQPAQLFPSILANKWGWRRSDAPPTTPGQDYILPNNEYIFVVRPTTMVGWKNVAAIELGRTIAPATASEIDDTRDWIIDDLRVTTMSGATTWLMASGKPAPNLVPWNGLLSVPVKGFAPPVDSVDDLLKDEERCCLHNLMRHLGQHAGYYWEAIWRSERDADRAVRLAGWNVVDNAGSETSLLDLVENRLLDFVDGYAVMPVAPGAETDLERPFDVPGLARTAVPYNEYVEQILTLPARGVFAEAKLGHCNASEVIDPTRFWDWQTSPIPDDAPEISPANLDSRYQDLLKALAATPFPSSLINIVNPQALPDPTGMAAAAGVMSALGPFRDMSGMKELGPYLQTLSNNATQLASQGMRNAQTSATMNAIRSAKEIPEAKRAELIEELLTGQVKQPAPTAPTGTTPDGTPPKGTTPTDTTPTPTPTPPIAGMPKPIPPPGVQRSPMTSPKNRMISFVFSYDSNHVMMGRFTVELQSGGEASPREQRMINTVAQVSGVDIGNKMEMTVPATFGGNAAVHVLINGTIVGIPDVLSSRKQTFELTTWAQPGDFNGTISRADFEKGSIIKVVQGVDPISFTLATTVQGTSAETEMTEKSGNVEAGWEHQGEVGGKAGELLEIKGGLKLTVKGGIGIKSGNTSLKQIQDGYTETVAFTGYRLKPFAPTISIV